MYLIHQQAGPAYWRGASVVCIDAFPAVLDTPVWREVTGCCSFETASVEVMMTCADAALRLQLILRMDSVDAAALSQRLETLTGRIVRLLENAGFDAHAAQDAAELPLHEVHPGTEAIMLVPQEQDGAGYVPASYEQVTPISLAAAARAVMAHPGAYWSLHLLPAVFLPEETACIAQNARYFAEQRRNETAARAYQALLARQDAKQFLIFGCATGPAAAIRELAQLHESGGLASHRAALLASDTPDALLNVPYALAEQVCLYGHTAAQAQRLAPALRRLSFMATAERAGALLEWPRAGEQLQGMTVRAAAADRQPLPSELRDEAGLRIGFRASSGEPVHLPPLQLTKHAVVVGMPGSGKTKFSLGMLIELHRKGYPFLAIEPTKTEYRSLVDVIPELRIYTPGRSDVAPMSLNPFLPPKGITLEEFLPSLTTVFTAAFSMPQPLDTIFADVLRVCYTRHGWRNSSTVEDANVTVFGLHEFICVFRETVQRSNYSEESKQNLLSGGVYRLQSLLNSNPVLFDTNNALPYDTLLERPTLIELDAIDNSDQKSLIMAMLLANLMLVVRHKQVCDGALKNVLMIDEAHLLLGQAGSLRSDNAADPRAATVQLLQNITVAIRAYGTGIIFADQSPEKLTREVVDNANIKVVFRLDSMDQRAMIGSSIGLSRDAIEAVRSQKPGEMFFHCNLLDRPVQVRTVNTGKVFQLRDLVPPDEVAQRMAKETRLLPPFIQCTECEACDPACRAEADYLARIICDDNLSILGKKESLLRFLGMGMPIQVRRAVQKHAAPGIDRERLTACVQAHLLRRIMLTCPADVTVKEIVVASEKRPVQE